MKLGARYLLSINAVLLLIWLLYFVADEVAERRGMLRLEVRTLRTLAGLICDRGFLAGRPLPSIHDLIVAVAREHPGAEVMVLDPRSMVLASSVHGRVGRPWQEEDISRVIQGSVDMAWKVKDHRHDGRAMLDVTLPVRVSSTGAAHVVHVASSLELVEGTLAAHRGRRLLWALASLLLMGVVISLVSHRWLLRPLRRVMEILEGSRWCCPGERQGDELQQLRATVRQMVGAAEAALTERDDLLLQVRSFNQELEHKIVQVRTQLSAAQATLVVKERLSAVGELAAGLAHELRTPLHIVRGAAELLAAEEANSEACQDIFEEVDRVSHFVDDLLCFTRPSIPEVESTRILPVIRSAVTAIRRGAPQAEQEIKLRCPGECQVSVGAEHLRQVVHNLLVNATQATSAGGRVLVDVEASEGRCDIRVEDSGAGIPPGDMERIFEPFFTRRAGGTGLGLAIVARLVALYQGKISVESHPGEGTTFIVNFPLLLVSKES